MSIEEMGIDEIHRLSVRIERVARRLRDLPEAPGPAAIVLAAVNEEIDLLESVIGIEATQ